MACSYCGTELPDGALFCGECGRSVASSTRNGMAQTVPHPPISLRPDEDDVRPADGVEVPGGPAEPPQPSLFEPRDRESRPDAGDSGEVSPVDVASGDESGDEPVETDVIAPSDANARWAPKGTASTDPADESGEVPSDPEPMPSGDPASGDPESQLHCSQCGTAVASDDVFCPSCGFLLAAKQVELPDRIRSVDPRQNGAPTSIALEDLEVTRVVAAVAVGDRFVLQFSTGESVTVRGSGLIGRNPAAEPGEFVDQLVPLFDGGKSVSKVHLEFGQDSGRFWVSDRFSTNGTVLRPPDGDPRRCEPGRRYLVARGTRVDIGEQFFVVS